MDLSQWGSTRNMDLACRWQWQSAVEMDTTFTRLNTLWFFFYGYVKGHVNISPLPTSQEELNQWGAGECYARNATARWIGAGWPTWRVSCHSWCAYWTFVQLCEIGYKNRHPLEYHVRILINKFFIVQFEAYFISFARGHAITQIFTFYIMSMYFRG